MTLLDHEIVGRDVVEGHDGRSGARIERVVLADGRRLVVKTSRPSEDVTVSLTGGVQRERELWASGALDLLPPGVAHAILEITEQDGATVTVMRDLGDTVPGWSRVLERDELGRVFDAMTAVHATYAGRVPGCAARREQRIGLLSEQRLGPVRDTELLAAACCAPGRASPTSSTATSAGSGS